MEYQSSPEKKKQPIFDNCMNCEKKYKLTEENTIAHTYARQPECNFLMCICPNCNFRTKMFCDPDGIELAQDNGIYLLEDDYADDETYKQWIDVKGIELPQEYELTDRHEKIIKGFAEALSAIPDDFFWDNIGEPTNRPYPERWV